MIKSAALKRGSPVNQDLDLSGNLAFMFSWLLVSALGLLPLFDETLSRDPTPSASALIVFFVAVGSAAVLRRHYSWVGVVMHVFSQIFMWLSVFCVSLAGVLYTTG
ncbi:hypothetical protein SAMIE_2000580 (plasmid) [Sphingobium amiense]|uniref:Uncharacterized protein n=2 Tax=Sphingobium TaxID=165695 RepID=A0A494W7C7_9SPHN|nr:MULTISPECIES: hypothetical protein [Sphingobium]BBE00172.1 hypothetical protein SAMIE_2000580 [Sphingobium amiense]